MNPAPRRSAALSAIGAEDAKRLTPAGVLNSPPPADWTPPRILTAIAAVPRSGSTYYGELIRRTGKLGTPGEYFNQLQHRPAHGADTIEKRCRLVASHGASANGVASLKLFPVHFWWLQKEIRLSEWFPDIRWVFVYRKDKLGSAVSAAIASLTSNWWGKKASEVPPPTFSARLIEEKLLLLIGFELSWTAFFHRNGIDPLTVVYEDLEERPAAFVKATAELAGVTLEGEPDTQTRTTRQRDALNEEWRARFTLEAGSQDWLDPLMLWRPLTRTPRNLRRYLGGKLAVGPPPLGSVFE